MNFRTRGIIIKRINYSEADRILTIITSDRGKVKAIAKGVRKILSKLAGSLEPFCLADYILHKGRTFYTVASASVENYFEKIRLEIDKTAKAFYIGELIDKFLKEGESHPKIFELLVRYLQCLNDDNDEILIPVFSAKILENLGFKPVTGECLYCRKKLMPERNFWDNNGGGIVCQSCHYKLGCGEEIDNNVIKVLRLIFSDRFTVGSKLNADYRYKKITAGILENYIEHVIERELKSKFFLRQVDEYQNNKC